MSSACVGSSCYLQQHAVTCGAMPWGTLQQGNLSSLRCSQASCVHIAVRCWLSTGCVQSMTTRASSILSLQRTQVCSIFQEPATWSEQCLCGQQLLSTWRPRRFVLQVLGEGCSNISKSLPCSQAIHARVTVCRLRNKVSAQKHDNTSRFYNEPSMDGPAITQLFNILQRAVKTACVDSTFILRFRAFHVSENLSCTGE